MEQKEFIIQCIKIALGIPALIGVIIIIKQLEEILNLLRFIIQ